MIDILSNAFGVSGYERDVREIIKSELCKIDAEISEDGMGNMIVRKTSGKNCPALVLSAYMDEPGFIITDITDDGYLKFDTVGGTDKAALISQRVKIGETVGIISLKAIHLTTKEEREKPVKTSDLFIDIGADSGQEAEEYAKVGDYCCFDGEFEAFGDNLIKGKALGSRVPCLILLNMLCSDLFDDINVTCLFTVQKEIEFRGIMTAASAVENASAAVFLGSHAAYSDDDCTCMLEKGAVIGVRVGAAENSADFLEKLCAAANDKKIKYQKQTLADRSDADVFESKRADIPSVSVRIPCKYSGTPVCVMSKSDIEYVYRLIMAAAEEVKNG